MNKKKILIVGLSFIGAVIVLLTTQETINALECRLVRITAGIGERLDDIALEPHTMRIGKGACVVWVNISRSPDVKIKFEQGEKCVEATDAPSGFKSELLLGCYVTGMIRKGGSSSLRFVEPGTFEYVIEATPQKAVRAKGKIIVE